MRTEPYTKTGGKYKRPNDNPELQRLRNIRNNPRRNAITKLTYKSIGGRKIYFALPKSDRLRLRAESLKQYNRDQLEDVIYNIAPPRNWTRTKRTLPKVDRPKSVRITTKKVVDSRGYVYIFKDHMKSDGLYKIGASHEPQERLDQANTWGDFESIYESEEVADCAKLEKEVHQSLRKYQVKGEWFKVSEDIAINTIKEIVNESFNYAVAS